ncbi:hypothetical protein BGY98DRAFT_1192275, partial [Russula aff. rugulosa BPL654]
MALLSTWLMPPWILLHFVNSYCKRPMASQKTSESTLGVSARYFPVLKLNSQLSGGVRITCSCTVEIVSEASQHRHRRSILHTTTLSGSGVITDSCSPISSRTVHQNKVMPKSLRCKSSNTRHTPKSACLLSSPHRPSTGTFSPYSSPSTSMMTLDGANTDTNNAAILTPRI